LIALFNQARRHEYTDVDSKAIQLERKLSAKIKPEERSQIQDTLDRLRRRYNEIARVDYFDCPEAARVETRLAKIAQTLSPTVVLTTQVARATIAEYRNKRWVTRPRPHVDRLACIWLIRRYINPKAVIRYASYPEPEEVSFDMTDARFGHEGNLCTFETLLRVFGLDEPPLRAIAEIVHEIDLRDGRYTRPATSGVDLILKGWLIAALSDQELETHGVALFEGLYHTLSNTTRAKVQKKNRQGGKK
jgi:hypothetical protein